MRSWTWDVFLGAFLLANYFASASAMRLVRTKQGYVEGIRQDFPSYQGHIKTVYKFLGVPYAEKPMGDLRFKRPQTLKSWRMSVYNATYFRPVCIQDKTYYQDSIKPAWPEFSFDEDCLYLNVYTPGTSNTEKYPVIVYIHGGSFLAGTPIRDVSPGELLPLRGVVLVTVQYRLGTFGFFSTGDSEAPGNVGLLDQVTALQWVQQNINAFGGDSNKVTLLGESAGGSSVSFHLLTPLSKGLFHQAIAVSGVDLCPFATFPKSKIFESSLQIAKHLNCDSASSAAMLQCLRSLPSSSFTSGTVSSLSRWMQPFVDAYFLPDDPKKLRETGQFNKLPLMSGFVSHEGSFLLKGGEPEYTPQGFKDYLQGFFDREFKNQNFDGKIALDALEFQYTPWADVHDSRKIRKKLVEMLTDYYIVAPTHDALNLHSDHGAPTYMFEFSHRSKLKTDAAWMGVVHGDTTAYKFGAPLLNSHLKEKFDKDDRNISDMIVTLYLNFAKFGNPTPTPVYGAVWDEFNSSTKAYFKIQKSPEMVSKPFHPARMAFWNYYFPKLVQPNPPSVEGVRKSTAASVSYGTTGFLWCIAMIVGKLVAWNG